MWTKFYDLSSGGSSKTDYEQIFIQLPMKKAIEYFKKKFKRNPNNITCLCCGEDFSIREVEEAPTPSKYTLVINEDEIF